MTTVDKWLTCKYDKVFKSIMLKEKNYPFLEAIIKTVFTDVKIDKVIISELPITNVKDKIRYLDCIIQSSNTLINIEINTNPSKTIKFRNFNYFTALFSNYMNEGDKYEEYRKYNFCQINFTYGLKNKGKIKNEYVIKEVKGNNRYIDNFTIIEVNMDKLKEKWEAKEKEVIEKYKYVLMMELNKKELEKLIKEEGDEIIMGYKEQIEKINRLKNIMNNWDYEKDNERVINSLKREYREEGEARGIQKGHLAGLKEGQNKERLSFAQNLKKMNMSLGFIAKALNVTENQAKQLLNE